MVRVMGRDEVVWRLQHVWPKDAPDVTDIEASDSDDKRLSDRVEDVKQAFERFIAEDVVPHVLGESTRAGRVESVRLFRSHTNTDYLLLVSGIFGGTGAVLDVIAKRYAFTTSEELGHFRELDTYELPESSG